MKISNSVWYNANGFYFCDRLDLGRKNPCGLQNLVLPDTKLLWRNFWLAKIFAFLCTYGEWTFWKPCYLWLLSSQYFRFWNLIWLEKEFFFAAGYFCAALFSGGERRYCNFFCKIFFFRSLLFLLRDFGLIFTSVSGLLIPVQNDHLKLQIGFCLFCFCLIHPFRPWMRRLTSGADSLLPT